MKEPSIDRTDWGPGPWDGEPDRAEWRTQAGLVGLAVRARFGGVWCGYVAVPPGHPLHGVDYRELEETSAHGGLTYSALCTPCGTICHTPAPGEPDDVWWFGFDCHHSGDLAPGFAALASAFAALAPPADYGTYRDLAYVRAVVESLAEQLAERGR